MRPRLRFSAGLLAGLVAFAPHAFAQDDQQQELQAKLEKKLAKEFVKNATWVLDYDAAKAKAKESGKLIFGYFTRSYTP